MDFERKLPTEQQDIADIVAGILAAQARFARQQKRPLGRGTHTKGVCVRATLEVFDVANAARRRRRWPRGSRAGCSRSRASIRRPSASQTPRRRSRTIPVPTSARCRSRVDVPGGRGRAEATRLDYSMNNAPTFPINDAHAFAAFMRVLGSGRLLGHLRALLSLSFTDLKGFFQTAVRGLRQQHGALQPYQQTRYWSNVPFLHGRDEAVKFSATPGARQRRAADRRGRRTCSRDELAAARERAIRRRPASISRSSCSSRRA